MREVKRSALIAESPALMYRLVNDIERVKSQLLQNGANHREYDLLLIGRRHLRSNNSWMHNSQRLVKGKPQCTLIMNPSDAAVRHLEPGQRVRVQSRAGVVEVPVEISADIMPGVVSMPHGWGHDRDGIQLAVAQENAGGSINDVTDNLAIDALCGTAAFNGTPVAIEAVKR